MTTFTGVLQGDLTGTAFGAAPTFTNYTAWLLNDDGVSITWGKQNRQESVNPTGFTFTLDNSDGRFTTGASIIGTGARFRFSLTVGANTYDRCDGYVDSVEVGWKGGSTGFAVVRVTCVDVSARLGEAQPLRSIYEQEVLADGPLAFLPFSEAQGAVAAGTVQSSSPSFVSRTNSKYGTGTGSFGGDQLIADDVTSFSATTFDRFDLGTVGQLDPTASFSVEVWTACTVANRVVYEQLWNYLGLSQAGAQFTIFSDAVQLFDIGTLTNPFFTLPASATNGLPHQIVGVYDATAHTFTGYFDGASVGSSAITVGSKTNLTQNSAGGRLGANDGSTSGFTGRFGMLSVHQSALSAARVLARYQAGVGTL